MDARIEVAAVEHRKSGIPIWIFATTTARYTEPVENHILEKLLALGVKRDAIRISQDFGKFQILDTVDEYLAIHETALSERVSKIWCVSNRLQLLQIQGLSRYSPLQFIFHPSPLVEWTWWYLSARLFLIPFAFFGVGKHFPPLQLVRKARAHWRGWPI